MLPGKQNILLQRLPIEQRIVRVVPALLPILLRVLDTLLSATRARSHAETLEQIKLPSTPPRVTAVNKFVRSPSKASDFNFGALHVHCPSCKTLEVDPPYTVVLIQERLEQDPRRQRAIRIPSVRFTQTRSRIRQTLQRLPLILLRRIIRMRSRSESAFVRLARRYECRCALDKFGREDVEQVRCDEETVYPSDVDFAVVRDYKGAVGLFE